MEYASNGKGNLGVTLGAVGTGLSILNSGGLGGVLGGLGNNPANSNEICDLRTKNAILEAEIAANAKVTALREELYTNIRAVEKRIDDNAAAQAVINCGFTSANAVLANQMNSVMGLCKLVIPSTSVCTASTTTT